MPTGALAGGGSSTGPHRAPPVGRRLLHAGPMPSITLVLVLLRAGYGPGAGRAASDGVPAADAPFTLTALDVGHPTFPFRCQDVEA